MGTGVAQNLLERGLDVVLVDTDPGRLDLADEEIHRYSVLARLLGGAEGMACEQGKLTLAPNCDALVDVDFVIENVTEDVAVKREVFRRLDAVCRTGTVIAANTSAIPITRLAALTSRPANVLGMHFMNPVPLKPTVEVIRAWHTSDETMRVAEELLNRMGKRSVVVADSPGFVSNRVLMLTINEAICLVHEGVGDAEAVDAIFKSCFGHPMGPLETADLIGLDTILQSIVVLYDEFKDSKYRPSQLLVRMVDAGLKGRKNGRGFYTYEKTN